MSWTITYNPTLLKTRAKKNCTNSFGQQQLRLQSGGMHMNRDKTDWQHRALVLWGSGVKLSCICCYGSIWESTIEKIWLKEGYLDAKFARRSRTQSALKFMPFLLFRQPGLSENSDNSKDNRVHCSFSTDILCSPRFCLGRH